MAEVIYNTQGMTVMEYEEAEMQVEYLTEELRNLLHRFEARYRTQVIGYVLAGSIGLWNGTRIGGKGVAFDSIFSQDGYDDMEVSLNEEGEIVISLHHHDGSHHMGIYFLTEGILRKLRLPVDGTDYWDYQDFGTLYEEGKAVKADKKFKEAFGIGGKGK